VYFTVEIQDGADNIIEWNWRSVSGTAGLKVTTNKEGGIDIVEWFGTDERLKEQLENVWNQCRQQQDNAYENLKKLRELKKEQEKHLRKERKRQARQPKKLQKTKGVNIT
jgi:hypothetical protein